MRISTAGLHNSSLALISERNSSIAKLNAQLSSGTRILTPADDPLGAAQALDLDRALAESQQHEKNTTVASNRLSLEGQSLKDTTSLLQRIRDLTIQANSGALDDASRQSIATEVQTRLGQLTDIANRKDGNNEYLFSGYSTLTKPFVQNGTAVTYAGDQGSRTLQVGPSQWVADSHPGSEVFMNIKQGNGTFVAAGSNTNTGNGIIDGGTVTDLTQWTPGTYRISFTSPTTYDVLDSTNATVSSGTFAPNGTIAFNGAQVQIQGQPATGDTFTISPAGKQDVFTTVSNFLTALQRPTGSDAQNALFAADMATTLTQIDHSLDNISAMQGEVGARLSSLDDAGNDQQNRQLQLQTTLSGVRDVDYASAITQLNLQMVGLQAAQQSYVQISQLSLFNYLR